MRRVIPLLCAAVLGLAACGEDTKDGGLKVTSDVVSHATTQDVLVIAPEVQGSWPVVLALHGVDGSGEDMAVIATRLGQEGSVVFAPTSGEVSRETVENRQVEGPTDRADEPIRSSRSHRMSDLHCGSGITDAS